MPKIIDSVGKSVYKPEGVVEIKDLTFEGLVVSGTVSKLTTKNYNENT